MEWLHGHLKSLGLHQSNEEALQALSSGVVESSSFTWVTGYPPCGEYIEGRRQ